MKKETSIIDILDRFKELKKKNDRRDKSNAMVLKNKLKRKYCSFLDKDINIQLDYRQSNKQIGKRKLIARRTKY